MELEAPLRHARLMQQMSSREVSDTMGMFSERTSAIFTAFNRASLSFTARVDICLCEDLTTTEVTILADTDSLPLRAHLTAVNHPALVNEVFKDNSPVLTQVNKGSKRSSHNRPGLGIAFSISEGKRTSGFLLRSLYSTDTHRTLNEISHGDRSPNIYVRLNPRELLTTTDPLDLGFMHMISVAEVPLYVPTDPLGAA